MPRIMIPALGSIIELEEDWQFQLYDENRNDPLQAAAKLYPPFRQLCGGLYDWKKLTIEERKKAIFDSGWNYTPWDANNHEYWGGTWSHEFVLRAGTRLKFDRIYIRQGQTSFDSVTFRTNCWVSKLGDPLFSAPRKLKTLRFWAKLADVNTIVGKFVND